jgi:hypothetical protein
VPILAAWLSTVNHWQPPGVVGRVHYWHGDCESDYLQGNSRGWGYGAQPPACNDQNLDQFITATRVSE